MERHYLTIKNYSIQNNTENDIRQIHIDYINIRATGSKSFNNLFKNFREYIKIFGGAYWITRSKRFLSEKEIVLRVEKLGINLDE
jgi:hypothetical protein